MKRRTIESNRFCVTKRVKALSLPRIKAEMLRGEGICEDFFTIDTPLPAACKTAFRVYEDGKELLVAVCLRDVQPGPAGEGQTLTMADDVELFFDPYHDRIGYDQFVFDRKGCTGPIHFMPYRRAHSTAFRHMYVKRFRWDMPRCYRAKDGKAPGLYALTEPVWLFAWFALDDVFRKGGACGFNVGRNVGGSHEMTTWNLCSGHGTQDATSFGALYRRKPAIRIENVCVEQKGTQLTIAGKGVPVKVRLVDPLDRDVPLSLRVRKGGWTAWAHVPRVPGRYRLYAEGKGGVAPRYTALDVAFPRRKQEFKLGITYDCPDDMLGSALPYTPEALEAEIEMYAAHGVERIHWIDYPPETLFRGRFAFQVATAPVTERNCGDLLPLAASIAKRKGLDFVGVHKPFDIAMDSSFWYRKRMAWQPGNTVTGLERRPIWTPAMVVANQDSTMRLHPEWHALGCGRIVRLRLYSTSKIADLASGDIRLWCSRDNQHYSPYKGAMKIETGRTHRPHLLWSPAGALAEDAKQANAYIEMSGLRLDSPFLAIEIRKDVKLTHRPYALVEAWDAEGNVAPVTLATDGGIADGFMFFQEWMSWANRSTRMLTDFTWGRGVHGVTFQRHPNLPTLLEPSCEAARSIWLWHVQRVLDTQADGISIRTLCHHNNIMDYMMYAFAEPVRETFRSLYKREVTPSWEDCVRVRRIRGDFYTDMFRDAKRLASKVGKKFVAHLEAGIDVPPECDQRMQFHENWREWINEGIVDEIILKWWFSQSTFIHEQVLPLAKAKGIPVHICGRNSCLWNTVRAVERAESLVRDSMAAGFAGFAFYEAADFKYRNGENRPVFRRNTGDAFRAAARTIEAMGG